MTSALFRGTTSQTVAGHDQRETQREGEKKDEVPHKGDGEEGAKQRDEFKRK